MNIITDTLLTKLAVLGTDQKVLDNTADNRIMLNGDGTPAVLLDTAVAMGILKNNLNDNDLNIIIDWVIGIANDSALSGAWGGGPGITKNDLLVATDPTTAVLVPVDND